MTPNTRTLGRGIADTMADAEQHASNMETMIGQAQTQIQELEAELLVERQANADLRRTLATVRVDLQTSLAHLRGH